MSLQDTNWIRTLLLGTSSVAMLSFSTLAHAQTETTDDEIQNDDEIVVTGFRQSLKRAQDIKLDADTFVDAITAEDIGALPDRSVAEALQRIPGVNISRFSQADDPDRFSVEGSGVVVRGLPFVRSELNGREVFSANGGRTLSFNDVSPELLGGVQVFKNTTADMVDGGISGTVNLITRKPLDELGPRIAGTIEANYGDLAEEVSPAFSVLAAHSYETDAGTFGLQLGFARSELISRTDASQVTDPCFRADTLDGACFRVNAVGSGGIGGETGFDASNFPPAGSVVVPKGAGIRTTTFDRDRQALSLIGQWESPDETLLVTGEYLRADADQTLDEYSILALVNDDALFPIVSPGTTPVFDSNGIFQSGTLTQAGPGIPTENLRFQREDEAVTSDYSIDLKWTPTDRLRVSLEGQKIKSSRTEDGIIASMQTYSDIFLDVGDDIPDVQFRGVQGGPNNFSDPASTFFWFVIDNQVANEGDLESFRADVAYDVGDEDDFFRSVRFGARWADRDRVTRSSNFSNWGNLSAPWLGNAIFANNPDPTISGSASLRNPFEDFQRGDVGVPVPNGAAYFFGGDDFVNEYLRGETAFRTNEIGIAWENTFGFWDREAFGPFPNLWQPLNGEFRNVSDVQESTEAFYGRVDFGSDDLFGGMTLEGNVGVRYVETTIESDGQLTLPPAGAVPDFDFFCSGVTTGGGTLPAFCSLTPERRAEFVSLFTGETINDDADIKFDHWLPSFNAKLEVAPGKLLRLGVSKGISRPDLSQFATGGVLGDNTNNLRQSGTLANGPLLSVGTGNRILEPVESINVDVSAEWYFDDVGSLTASYFYKDLEGLITGGPSTRDLTLESGQTTTIEVNGPANVQDGFIQGFEVAYQDTFEFLPGPFDGLGTQLTYTYVDASDLDNSTLGPQQSAFAGDIGLVGVSEHTVNVVGFYENDKVSGRLAYNWRSDYALTGRDVIFPFSPIIGESTGQLDGSLFYNVNDRWKVGVQAVNLLDEVTRTSQIFDFDGSKTTRSAFRNDRRFSFLARFDF